MIDRDKQIKVILTSLLFLIEHSKIEDCYLNTKVKVQESLWADGYYCGSAGHVSQESVKRYINEQEGKKVFEYDIYECPKELKGQLKIGKWVK